MCRTGKVLLLGRRRFKASGCPPIFRKGVVVLRLDPHGVIRLAGKNELPDKEVGEDTDLSELPLLKLYENKRGCPRVDLRVPVTVSTADREMIRARMRNISPEGLQFRCPAAAAARLRPDGTVIDRESGAVVMVRFNLPVGDDSQPFVATGRLIYIAARRPGEIAFGVTFSQLQPIHQAQLDAFIEQALIPKELAGELGRS